MASATLRLSTLLQCTSSNKEPTLVSSSRSILTNYFLPRQPPSRFTGLAFSTRRRDSATPSVTSKKIKKKNTNHKTVGEDEDIDEDAFEALFRQLEEDLKNDELNGNDGEDDDVNEEELKKLEQELTEALGDDELLGALDISSSREETESEDEDEDGDEDEDEDGDEDDDDDGDEDEDGDDDGYEADDDSEEEEEETPIKLKNWQLRRLAYALKNGRRKTSIKNLAADLCLDRAVVLKLLRDPPPNLVMLSATLPDKPASTIFSPVEAFPLETHTVKPEEVKKNVPVHIMQSNWSARKRLKKVQVETLEQVYKRTKRPTNAMISSIVHVTNLPRRKVVKWFEDKRVEEGVPEHRLPYRRSASGSVFTS